MPDPIDNNRRIETILTKDIRLDEDLQPRAEINQGVVTEYAEDMRRDGGDAFPPLHVFHDGTTYWLADGFHRYQAAVRLNAETVSCMVHPGSKKDAAWFACGSNRAHGLRRTNADKERAVKNALRQHPEKSDADIARHVGVSDKTVAKYRQQLQATSEIPKSNRRIGADGRAIETTQIGTAGRHAQPAASSPNGVQSGPGRAGVDTTAQLNPDETRSAKLAHPQHAEHQMRQPAVDPWDELAYLIRDRIQQDGPEHVWSRLQSILQGFGFQFDGHATAPKMRRLPPEQREAGSEQAIRVEEEWLSIDV